METTDSVREYETTARLLVSMLRPVLVQHPTRDMLQECVESALNRLVRAAVTAPENERTISAPIYGLVIQSYIDVALNNPMYDTRGLVLQWDHAIDKRLKDFFKRMSEKKEKRDAARSAGTGG